MRSNFYKYLVILFLMVFLLPMTVFAQEKLELKVDKTDLEIGDEITVSAIVKSDLDTYALIATLKYDQNVFEKLDDSNFSISDTEIITYNQNNNKFGIINKTGRISDREGTLFTVKLKVKDDAGTGDTDISLTNISYSNSNNEKEELSSVTTKVSVKGSDKVVEKENDSEINENNEEPIKTFTNTPFIIILIVLLLAVISYIIYKYKKEKEWSILSILLGIVLLVLIIILFSMGLGKKDVNNDGKVDYDDAKEIIEYLINIDGRKEENKDKPKEDYDTNNDGKVDINDVSHVVQETNKNSSAKLEHINSEIQYVTKGEDIILAFKAEITPKGTYIKKVKIGDKYYEVTKDGDTYYVNIGSAEKAGLYNYEITKVILSNKKEIKANLKFDVEVLKSKPTIENLYIANNSKLHFTLIDKDKTIISGKIIIKDESGKEIKTIDMSSGKTEMEYELGELEKNKKYTVSIEVTYDLDEDRDNNKNETTEVITTHNFQIEQEETEYAFNISDFKLVKIENGKVTLEFTSNTDKNHKIDKAEVYLNGVRHEYQVTETGNKHTIEIPTTDTNGRTEINIKGVILNNLGGYNSDTNKDQFESLEKIIVFKDKPTAKIGKVDVIDDKTNELATTINVNNINITDSDKTITNKYAVLKLDNKEVKRIPLTTDNITFGHDLDEILRAGSYTIDIVATYDLVDGNGTTEKTLKTDIVTIKAKAKITKTSMPETFVEKGSDVALEYTVKSNTGVNVSEFTINNSQYTVANLENDVYKATYKAQDSDGFETISLTNIKFENNMAVTLSKANEKEIDVLKAKPQIENVTITNEDTKAIIQFNVTDEDNALNDSYMKITDTATNQEKHKAKINKGLNKFEVELETETLYELTIENNATLSHNKDGEKRTYNAIYRHSDSIQIFDEKHLDFSIKNLSVPYRVSNDAKNVTVTFENELLTTETVSSIKIDGVNHNVTRADDGTYSTVLNVGNKGLNTLHVDSVKLGNKDYDVDRVLPYVRENVAPEANNVKITEDSSTGDAKVTYKLTDKDTTIRSLKANLRNSSGVIVETKNLNKTDAEEFTMPLTKSYIYSIELVATYDIGDNKTFVEKSLFREEQNGDPFVIVAEKSINKELVNKGEDVTIRYKLKTNIDKDVNKLFIGDISYPVKKALNGKEVIEDTYDVTVPAPKASGIFEQEITTAIIGNKPYAVTSDDDPIAINVAKDIPTVTQFTIDPKDKKISFKLNDKDDALNGGFAKLIIIDNDTNTQIERTLKNDVNEFTFSDLSLSIGKKYTAKVEATYNVNPTEETSRVFKLMSIYNIDDEYTSKEIFDRDIEVPEEMEYTFEFESEISWFGGSIEPYIPGPNLVFKVTTNVESSVSKVVIDGEEFYVNSTGKEDEYELDHYIPVNFRESTAHYEKVIFENGLSFDIDIDDENSIISQFVTLPAAKLEIVDFQEDFENNTVTFYFNINDPDNVVASDLTLYLKNSKGEYIDEGQKVPNQKSGSVKFNVKGKESSEYRIGGTATQYQATGAPFDNVYLVEQVERKPIDIVVHSSKTTIIQNSDIGEIKIDSDTINTKYPEQGTTIPITYTISSTKVTPNLDKLNNEELEKATLIKSLIINGTDYPVDTVSSTKGEYKVYYPVPNTPGVHEINLTGIVFKVGVEEEILEIKRTDQIDVLKKVPTIENFKTTNNAEDGTITFDFDFIDTNDVLKNTKAKAIVENVTQDVKVGEHNTLTFKATKNKILSFEIKASYDLDSNTLEQDKNSYTNQAIVKKQFVLTDDYNADVINIKVANSKGEETLYFEKNEKIKLSFNFTSKHKDLYPEKVEINEKEYKLSKDINDETRFITTIDGYKDEGKKYVKIDSVTLNSGNKVMLENKETPIEVLKDAPKLDDFSYYLDDNVITLDFEIEDEDHSIINNKIYISAEDEFGRSIQLSTDTLKLGDNTVTFTKNDSSKYMIKISADYSRDNEGKTEHLYYHEKGEIANKVVTVTESNHIELKDITNIKIYKFNDIGEVAEHNTLTGAELSKFVSKNYLVKISMKDLPEVYVEIKKVKKTEDGYELELDYKDAKVYVNKVLTSLTLKLTESNGNYTYSGNLNTSSESKADSNYLPDEELAQTINGYESSKKLIYQNMYKLMPFADIKEIIKNGNKVSDSDLTKKAIKYVLAYNKEGKLVNYLTTRNYDCLSRIRVVFVDNTGKDYKLNFDSYYGNIASYIIKDLRIPYNYNKYVVKADNDAVKQLTQKVTDIDYSRELDPLSNYINDSRLYKEHYEEVIDKELDDIITSILVRDNYIPTFENDLLKSIIRDKYQRSYLKQLLYSYNYLDYWYDINMNGANISDTLAFHGKEMFGDNDILEDIYEVVINNKTSATTNTIGFYDSALKKFAPVGDGKGNIVDFMEFYIKALTNYEDGNSWFKDNWHGGLYREVNVKEEVKEEDCKDMEYTYWWHFKSYGNVQTYFLSLFNVPDGGMYIVSMPTQVLFGSLRTYVNSPENKAQMENFNNTLDIFCLKMARFYYMAAKYSDVKYINNNHQIVFDQRYTYPDGGKSRIFNSPGTTNDPYQKYFAESNNKWAGGSAGAYATGREVFFVVYATISTNLQAITHESAHNQDDSIFLNGYKKRAHGAAEDYAEHALAQSWGDGTFNPNFIEDTQYTDVNSASKGLTTHNWSYKRIDTDEELKDYYNKLFMVNDYLDYLEAEAFLELTAEQKAKIARQLWYPTIIREEDYKNDIGAASIKFENVTPELMEKIKTREDLWDNRIVLRQNGNQIGPNNYDTDNLYGTHWYQAHNNNGRPDTASMKYLFWEMAGIGGYYEGFNAYASSGYIKAKIGYEGEVTDLIALKYITKDETMTFRKYKLDKYDMLEKKYGIDFVGQYINGKELKEQFKQAMIKDAENNDRSIKVTSNLKKTVLLDIKLKTNDLVENPFAEK